MSVQRYYIDTRRLNAGWERPSLPWFYSLDDALDFITQNGLVNEKSEARIVAENGEVIWWGVEPVDGGFIDRAQSGAVWLEELRESYGFEEHEFRHALEQWLQER